MLVLVKAVIKMVTECLRTMKVAMRTGNPAFMVPVIKFSSVNISFLFWCFKCVKLENNIIAVIISVQSIDGNIINVTNHRHFAPVYLLG